ncbi:MAG: transcription elongation factor GreA [Bryobacterales bacterium]|nr:transcription elongation factor GreA [Bryobacterales bacterium]
MAGKGLVFLDSEAVRRGRAWADMQLKVIERLEDEIRDLESELHGKLPKEIQTARELGDLSENAEYHAAKERQRLLNVRMTHLSARLAQLRLIDFSKIPKDAVGLGSTVVVFDVDADKEVTYELVTTEESDVAAGKISTTSPIGRSLLGKRDGDVAEARTPGGVKEFEILSLRTIHEMEGATQ